MVCCLIGAFILGMIVRAGRWTGRSVMRAFGRGDVPTTEPLRPAPKPVYEMPAYVTGRDDRAEKRTPELV